MRHWLRLGIVCSLLAAPLARADEGIPAKTLDELKAATVYVKVEGGQWAQTGSGFLIQVKDETGLVATNHHVITGPPNQPAGKFSLVFWSGTKKEKVFSAEVVCSDSDRDLAILKVTAKDLPKPLDLSQKVELRETMSVYTLGFPLGDLLSVTKGNPALTIGKATISSIREDESGKVKRVQLDGELNPGNSGGPVTDAEGKLVGIAVAKIRGTKISFAIPPAELSAMLNGRISALVLEVKSADSGVVELEVDVRTIDPLGKISKIEVRYVRKDALKEQPEADKDGIWPELAGSEKVELKIDGQKSLARVTLKNLEKKRTDYLFQPTYVNGEGKTIVLQPSQQTIDFGKNVVTRPPDPQGSGSGTGSGSGSKGTVVTPGPDVGAPTGKDFDFALKLPQYLAVQIDPKSGTLFLTTKDGLLKHYSYPDFKFRGDYKLPGGVIAYRAALDAAKGALYLAVASKDKLKDSREGRTEGPGNILAFDVMNIIDKKGDPGTELTVATEYKADAVVRNLIVAPEGDSVYFLDVTKDDKVSLVRINSKTRKFDEQLKLADKTETMFLTQDGKTLYAAASPEGHSASKPEPYSGIVQKIDPAAMKLAKKANIAADPSDIVASNAGLVFVSGGSGQHSEITVVDMNETYSITGRWKGPYMGAMLSLAPDGKKLFMICSNLSPVQVESWVIPETINDTVPSERVHLHEMKGPMGGAPYLSPDGKCILSQAGGVYWTAAAKTDK